MTTSVVSASLSLNKAFRVRSNECKVYLYNQGDYNAMSLELECYLAIFNRSASFTDVDNLCNFFKQLIYGVIETYIPVEAIGGSPKLHKAWFNKAIVRILKSKRRAYKNCI